VSEFADFRLNFGIVSDDFDVDSLPDDFALALAEFTACREVPDARTDALLAAYELNLGELQAEAGYAAISAYENALAVLMAIGFDTQSAIRDVLDESDLDLEGVYEKVTCVDAGDCLPMLEAATKASRVYLVESDPKQQEDEVLSGNGDFDFDTTTNAVEFANVNASDGGIDAFLAAATDSESDGTTQDPGCGAGASSAGAANLAADALMLFVMIVALCAVRRGGRQLRI
jgi:hypothetical protein